MSTATATASPFAIKANNSEGYSSEQPPAGLHPCVLVALIDLGTHVSTFQNDKGERPMIRQYFYVWELTGEHDSEGNTFLASQAYNSSFHKKSGGRQMIESWLGRSFADEEEFDPATLIGREGLANIVYGVAKGDGKGFAKLDSICPPIRNLTVPKPTRPFVLFHISQLQSTTDPIPVPEWIPRAFGKVVIAEIKSSEEYKALPSF